MTYYKHNSGSGVSFIGLLTVLFVALKLTEQIDWSWLWVLSPMWIGLAIVLIVFVCVFGAAFIGYISQ